MPVLERGAAKLDAMLRSAAGVVASQDIDVQAYLADEEAPKVRPALYWLDTEAGDDVAVKSYRYPWSKLHGRFDMRMGELTLWTGWAKHGKSTALDQVCLSAMAQGAKVGFISLEFAVPALVNLLRWQSVGLTSAGMTPLQRDEWREWVDQRLWLYDHHGMQEGTRIAAVVWHMVKNLGIDVVVVDSLMMCGVRADGDGFATVQTEFLNRLVNVSREFPCHIHLVAHARKDRDDSKPCGLLDVSGSANLVNMPHNVLSFWRNKRPHEKRDQDAILAVVGDRIGGMDGDLDLWWHETARQFIERRDELPTRYCR